MYLNHQGAELTAPRFYHPASVLVSRTCFFTVILFRLQCTQVHDHQLLKQQCDLGRYLV